MGGEQSPGYIDTHVHIWSSDLQRYRLGEGFTPEVMKPTAYSADDILREARPSGVDRIVLVQINFYGFDNTLMLEAIRGRPAIFRGVAVIDATGEAPDLEMNKLAKLGVKAFRLHPEEVTTQKLDGAGYVKMFRSAADQRLAICLLMNPESLAALDRQCQKFPETPIVIDHLARIGAGNVIRETDIKALCALAKYPEVRVKVSAFYALGKAKPPHLDLAPLVQRVYEAFGPERLMWGSDCPFHLRAESYDDGIAPIRDHFTFLSDSDRDWILRRTAEELFFS
jgi:predicted TIM-barrel fold metal-dependent hydrolase